MTGYVETPRGRVFIDNTQMKAKLIWYDNMTGRFNRQYSEAQKFVDSEVLRLSEPYTPLLTGMMILTGQLGTHIGSGAVSWIAPYSAYQYYRAKVGSATGLLRGGYWFTRMKAVHGATIVRGARLLAGGGERS